MDGVNRPESVSEGKGEFKHASTVSISKINKGAPEANLEMLVERTPVEEKSSSLSTDTKETKPEQKAVRDGRNNTASDKLMSIDVKENRENGLQIMGLDVALPEKSLGSSSKKMKVNEDKAVMVAREQNETENTAFNSTTPNVEGESKELDSAFIDVHEEELDSEHESNVSEEYSVYSEDGVPQISEDDDTLTSEASLTDREIEELISEYLETESKAAEAQETLEKESLAQVENEVRLELSETFRGHDLDVAVAEEMQTFTEQWEEVLDDLESESALLLEQLDGAGVDLPSLFKWIESQAPEGCTTEAWRKRIHWVGSKKTNEVDTSISGAEEYLDSHRPVKRRHGKVLEEGASGFLAKRLKNEVDKEALREDGTTDWNSVNVLFQSQHSSSGGTLFGSAQWASIYLASTPEQAANMGLKLPGVNEVEEIDDIEGYSNDPFYAEAVATEKETGLTEEQKKNFRKIVEDDDVNAVRELQNQLKKRRNRQLKKKETINKESSSNISLETGNNSVLQNGVINDVGVCTDSANRVESGPVEGFVVNIEQNDEKENMCRNADFPKPSLPTSAGNGSRKHFLDHVDHQGDPKRSRMVIIDSDDDGVDPDELATSHLNCPSKMFTNLEDKKPLEIVGDDLNSLDKNKFTIQTTECPTTFQCTVCFQVLEAFDVCRHPLLDVCICRSCRSFLNVKLSQKDQDCSECFCGWCGRSSELINCKTCKMLFCVTCIKRNLGEVHLRSTGWVCCCCCRGMLKQLILDCDSASKMVGSAFSGSESGSESSDEDVNVPISKKHKKKRIRRILSDAELGEETKRKIAIEKERQDHIRSLHASGKSWNKIMSCHSVDEALLDDDEVMGDPTVGYIVNVAREENEDPVRVAPSISAILKPHQIAGIKFMWENCIQSIRKMKSGDKGLGCILAHTMGLGKTLQVIAFLYTAMRSSDLGLRTALIVTPVNVLHNWRQEFDKWRPSELKTLRVYMLEDVSREICQRARLLAKWRHKGGVLLIGYAAFRNLSLGKHVKDKVVGGEICDALQNGPDILVCDEAHMIKNTRADITQALRQVKCQRRIALTGSPLQNNLMEYYCMVDFVREGFLGSSHEFRNRFQNPIENGQHTNSTLEDVKTMNERSHILYEQLKGFVHRMDATVVKRELPPKTVYVISVKLSPMQRKLYKSFLDVHGFANGRVSNEKALKKSCFFAGYQALARIWNHPGLLQMTKEYKENHRREDAVENFLVDDTSSDDNLELGENSKSKPDLPSKRTDNGFFDEDNDWWVDILQDKIYKEVEHSGKMVLLLEVLSMSSAIGDKVLVFSQSLATLDLIELYLSKLPRHERKDKFWKKGRDWYRLDGSTDASERQKMVEKFNCTSNIRVKCALISTKAGSLGINLQAANRVVVVDGSWNPTNDLQAIYRVWRYGQKKPVYAYRMVAHGTMEDKIYKRQVTKEGLAARVVDRQQIHRTMSKEEVLHLFEFGEEEIAEMVPDWGKEKDYVSDQEKITKQDKVKFDRLPLPSGTVLSDKLMENLLDRHHPRWIMSYHEHETLLQENEAEKLSKEEQDQAWETYRQALESEVQRISMDETSTSERRPSISSSENAVPPVKSGSRPRSVLRRCTNLAHLLTLRNKNIKAGCSIVCTDCAMEISWENLNRDGRNR